LATLVWFGTSHAVAPSLSTALAVMLATLAAAVLMVSNLRYYSFKNFDLRGRVPFVSVLAVVLVFALVSLEPPSVLCVLSVAYAASGVIETLVQRRRRRAARRAEGRSAPGS
jgi:CDP-diacylglycerol--serine O-phosphatidyltransferase